MLFGDITHSAPVLLIALVVAGALTFAIARVRENRKIHKLGGRAKLLPGPWFLFGDCCFPFL